MTASHIRFCTLLTMHRAVASLTLTFFCLLPMVLGVDLDPALNPVMVSFKATAGITTPADCEAAFYANPDSPNIYLGDPSFNPEVVAVCVETSLFL